jgi:predicted nucleic-acid-binding Zn-ribbon protein
MEIFKGRINEKCSKCGTNFPFMKYIPPTRIYHKDKGFQPVNEHLNLTCKACGYNWERMTLNKEDEGG